MLNYCFKIAEDNGIKMIAIRGRTRCQMFKGKSDWKFVEKVKNSIQIPVLVNGDINSIRDVKEALKESRILWCYDRRSSYIEPWIFREIKNKENQFKIDLKEKKDIILNRTD